MLLDFEGFDRDETAYRPGCPTARRPAGAGCGAARTLSQPCGNCDNCLTPPRTWDATEAVRKALSCVYRTGQRFGVVHLIASLAPAGASPEQRRVAALRAWSIVHGLAMLMLDNQVPAEDALIDAVIDSVSVGIAT